MKIIHVCLNGAVTDELSYQDNLLPKYHKKMGLDVVIVTSLYVYGDNGKIVKMSENYMEYFNTDGIKTIRIPMKKGQNYQTKMKRYNGLSNILENEKPDYIFIHDFQYPETDTIRNYLKKYRNVIAYADNHADYSNSATNWISKNILHRIIWRYYAKRIEPYITKFYGVLPARVTFMKELYGLPDEKCELLVMGADDQLVESSKDTQAIKKIRAQYGVNDDDFFIVTGGKIDAAKRQTLLLLQAIKNVGNERIKCLVFGSVTEELQSDIKQLVDGVSIQYIGWIKANDSYKYFAAADLVFFPGRHSVFWEQVVAQGKPLVVKDWEGTHHIDIGGNVMYISEDSVKQIEVILKNILDTENVYSKMKEAANGYKKDSFLYSHIAERSIV